MSTYKRYTSAQKAAYYKKKAAAASAVSAKKPIAKKRPASRTYHKPPPPPKSTGMLASVGSTLGSAFGGPVGGALGGLAGSVLSKITGFGDYVVEQNSLMSSPNGILDPPQVVNSSNRGGIIVRHREYLQDLNAQTSFTLSSLAINPGVYSSFPWLSQIAASYEEYEFRGLIFEYKSLSSDSVLSSSTSSALGFVAMATQYNPTSAAFADKKELENYEFANSAKPSCSFMHPVECKRRLNFDSHLFVRTGSVPSGQDQKTYDLGNFSVAIGGCQAASGVAGELWVSYEVEFFHPKFKYGAEVQSDHWYSTDYTNAAPLGVSTTVLKTGSNLGTTISGNVISFPANITGGQYQVTTAWAGTGNALAAYPVVTGANCTFQALWLGDTATSFSSPTNAVNTLYMLQTSILKITGASATLTYGGAGTLPTGTKTLDIYITPMSSTITV